MHGENATYEGFIRKDPISKKEITLAALSCNSNKDRGDRNKYVKNISALDPDLIFFAGDQSYDHKEHTAAWLKFGIQFRELFRIVHVLLFLMTMILDRETFGEREERNL